MSKRKLPMTDPTGDRRRIADYLASHGPTHGDRLAESLGLSLGRFWPLINCAWFDIEVGGWDLTELGRQASSGEPVSNRVPEFRSPAVAEN